MNHQYFDIQVTAVPCTRVLYKVKLAAFFIAWVASVFGANSRSNTCYAARVTRASVLFSLTSLQQPPWGQKKVAVSGDSTAVLKLYFSLLYVLGTGD